VILDGKTVIVMGVGRGLGGEIARCAARDGANVVIAARSEDTLVEIAQEIDPSGDRIAHQTADLTDPERCRALAQEAVDRFGGVDALVQVAALDSVFGGIESVTPDDWRRTYEVNVVGTAQMVQAVAPHLKKRGGGSIVLVGSQSSMLPLTPQVAYAASKGALQSAMRFMAKELGPDRIRVNCVVPTWMWGPPVQLYVKWQARQRGVSEDEIVREITANLAIPEIPADEDVAEAVVFFCSERARMITGQSLLVNAGEFMP